MELKEIKNRGIRTKNVNGKKLSFLAGCVVGEELYFSSWTDKGFYKLHLNTGRCIPLKIFDSEAENMCLFSQAIYYEDAIWFVPCYGEHVIRITLDTLETEYIYLPQNGKELFGKKGQKYGKFKCCYKEGAPEFWLAPIGYNMLLKVDMQTKQITEFSELRKRVNFKDAENRFSDACFVDNKIWFCPRYGGEITVFDTVTGDLFFHEWKHADDDFKMIRNYKNWVVFLSQSAKQEILLIDSVTLEERKIRIDVDWEKQEEFMYVWADIVNQQIFFVPFLAHEYVVIDLETGEVQADTKLHEYAQSMGWGDERYQVSIGNEKRRIYTSDSPDMPLMIYDMEENEVSYMDLAVDREDYISFLSKLCENNEDEFIKWVNQKEKGVIFESDLPLMLYCSELKTLKNRMPQGDVQGSVGEKLFTNIK